MDRRTQTERHGGFSIPPNGQKDRQTEMVIPVYCLMDRRTDRQTDTVIPVRPLMDRKTDGHGDSSRPPGDSNIPLNGQKDR